ncbi:TetR/AcrR family transcriptional regulator [Pseudomonas sp. NPDC087814]|uniref:TetR/AcrR family transcriptional regulator n=1 Tax=unclassified Pseudomonas TaxID=196821 RepID=UPI00130390A3|nr:MULTISPECIES: TetR/AcrR family transcriptional regulator [unclassified Pseudomonas]MBT1265479.1 TetR/AcrR family transcriptional regulator [Pseudomonas sp. VS38]NWC71496.1 TetR/AcrR family transcriptional regulator [Pseudomonas sp. P7758]
MARPRKFNEDAVLDKATDIFWSKGYDGTSVAELTKAMGISAPSLYFAFGSKRGLFDAVLERYDQRRLAHRDWILAAPTGREAARRMLIGAVEWLTTADEPLGCLLVQSGLANGLAECDVATELSRRRNRIRAMLRERFELAQQQGDLASTQDADALALYIQTVFDGLCLQAAAGTVRQQLETVVARALMSWPV